MEMKSVVERVSGCQMGVSGCTVWNLVYLFIGFWCQLRPLYDFFILFFSIFVSFESGSINKLPKYQALKCF